MSIYKSGKKLNLICKNNNKQSKIYSNENCIYSVHKYRIMTVKIDQKNKNPETCCTYADDAVDMIPGSAEWDTFFGHYPVMLKNGVEGKKLNRDNFAQYEDGTTADITSGDEGDVMIAFPRMGIKISTDSKNVITVSMTDNPNNPNFEYNAHRRNDVQKNIFYLGAYKGFELNNKLRSLSDKKPTLEKTIGQFRTLAQANGQSDGTSSGYEQSGWFQLIFRQVMYLLKFKNLNSQSVTGMGNVDWTQPSTTGGTNKLGMDRTVELTNNRKSMKCLGIEDFWGSISEYIDGIGTDVNYNIMTATTDFNDNMSNYKNLGISYTKEVSGYINTVQGTTEAGFIVKTTGSDATSLFSDYGYINKSRLAYFGGNYSDNTLAGVFNFRIGFIASSVGSVAGRLMYL